MERNNWRLNSVSPFDTKKSCAYGSNGMVVANHPLAAAAGAQILLSGGNAIDGAVAALFALSVTEPMMVGIFGAGFFNIRLATGQHLIVDNYAKSPRKSFPDMFRTTNDPGFQGQEGSNKKNVIGPLSIGVGGSLKGWCHVQKQLGNLDLSDVIVPAINIAKQGFVVSDYLSNAIKNNEEAIRIFPATSREFIPNGQLLKTGDRFTRYEYAETLRAIAKEGESALYGGSLGNIICDFLNKNGGLIDKKDLEDYSVIESDPVKGSYRDYEIFGPPPPCAGGIHLIQLLNILEGFDIQRMGFGDPKVLDIIAKSVAKAFIDRDKYTGDPKFSEIPIERIISKSYADDIRSELGLNDELMVTNTPDESDYTTHVTVGDGDGNVVSTTQTIHDMFGSKVTVPGTGILLNNNMALFDSDPGGVLSVEPGKRMTSSMAPTIVTQDGKNHSAIGVPGGLKIFPSILQGLLNLIDHRMTPQEAVEAPRIWTKGGLIEIERTFSSESYNGLCNLGNDVTWVDRIAGGMNMIKFESDGLMAGATCWRADGHAVGIGGSPADQDVLF
ncbi:gamma-glutamyltransferase [Dehalococcoidia bacterium]|nr:gamma-glutamyltransferase [Dehalococcoidia bacterium]